MRVPDYASLDDALDMIAPYGIALDNGNFNHAPMVAEALCALGRPEAVMPWLARYRGRMTERAPSTGRIGEDWRDALGRRERFADWSLFFGEELRQMIWPQMVERWTGRLASGFCAAATHGVIRVGHAVRALSAEDTAARRRELADAFAGWAATWQELPAGNPAVNGRLRPRAAIAEVKLVPSDRRRPGNIVAALEALGDFPEFAPVVGLIDTAGAIAPLIAELNETFAGVFLANAHNIPTAIAFIHGLTSHAALGNIAPRLGEATTRTALRYAWQTGCGLYACYGGGSTVAAASEPRFEDAEELADSAIANGDEHVIKFTEACLSRNAIDPAPAYLAAARQVQDIIRRR